MSHPSPLGIQLYSVRDDIGPADLGTTLKRLAGMGFTHAEPYRILDRTEQLGEALAAAGLRATAAHANVTGADRDAYFEAAERLGLDTLIVPWTEPDVLSSLDGIAAAAAAINDAARRAADRGLRVGYHNHDFEFSQHVDGRPAYEILADALDGSVVLEVDTFWASMGGADVFELIPRLGTPFVHMPVVEVVVHSGDVFPVLERNAAFFLGQS